MNGKNFSKFLKIKISTAPMHSWRLAEYNDTKYHIVFSSNPRDGQIFEKNFLNQAISGIFQNNPALFGIEMIVAMRTMSLRR